MSTYYLYKVDLLDAYPGADIYDDFRYKLLLKSKSRVHAIKFAIGGFIFENEPLISWQNWFDNAEDGGFDFIVAKDNKDMVFRASYHFKLNENNYLSKMVDIPEK